MVQSLQAAKKFEGLLEVMEDNDDTKLRPLERIYVGTMNSTQCISQLF